MNRIISILKLKNVQQSLEKSESLIIDHINVFSPECNILSNYKHLNTKRLEELEKLQKDVLQIWLPVQQIKKDIFAENLDLQNTQNQVVTMQNNLKDLKLHLSKDLMQLHSEECELSNDVCSIEMLYNNYCKSAIKSTETVTGVTIAISKKCISSEIDEFYKFRASAGNLENQWSVDDHQLFIRLRKKFKSTDKFIKAFHAILPSYTEEEILHHELWYVKYLELHAKQKEVISKWKQSREIACKPTQTLKHDNDYAPDSRCSEEANEKQQQVKEKLKLWKKAKEERLQQEQESKKEMEARCQQKQLLNQAKRNEIRSVVQEWKYSKLVQAKAEKVAKELISLEEKKLRAVQANLELKKYRSNDEFYKQKILRRKTDTQADKMHKKTTHKNLPAKKLGCRDPNRLLKPTKTWMSRCLAKKASLKECNNLLMKPGSCVSVTNIPKLAIPNWMQNKDIL